MRAVRYGVTRHHVLGLEVVLADGTVLRTGGKFVKCSSGYDLTQLLIGSEGTLAVTTEITVKVQPRLVEAATVLAPFATLAEVAQAVPQIVEQRRRPDHSRVHRRAGHGRDHRKCRPGPRHSRRDQGGHAGLSGRRAGGHATPSGWKRTPSRWATLLERSARSMSTSSRAAAGSAADRGPGEGVLRVQGGRGGRHRRRRRPARGHPGLSGPGGRPGRPATAPSSPAAAMSATATSTCRSSSPTRTDAMRCSSRSSPTALAAGGAISGEHGIGTEKLSYFLDTVDAREPRPHALHQEGLRPVGDPRTRSAARRRQGDGMNGARALLSTLVGAGVDVCFANPGTSEMHFVAALDDVPEMRGILTLFEGVATGAADGYARVSRTAGGDAAAPGPRTGQRPGQPAQRPAGPLPAGQHCGRPRHLPRPLRRARSSPTSPRWPARSRGGTG